MSILSLVDAYLDVAGTHILDGVNWQIQARDKIALVGRNGSGKSTLLKVINKELILDKGHIHQSNGLCVSGLMQDVPVQENDLVYHFLVKKLGALGEVLSQYYQSLVANHEKGIALGQQRIDEFQAWEILPKIEIISTQLNIDPTLLMNQLSGGMKRRVLLAAALLAEPNLLLLDEPTNHLDIQAIEWLESYLKQYSGSVLVVTHDREFLRKVANRIVEIDRGSLNNFDCDYETYLDRREANRFSEQRHNALFDKRLREEEAWLREGIKARRTRNEGRVRALKAMRELHQKRRNQIKQIQAHSVDVARSGNIVLEADHLHYEVEGQTLLKDFSFLLTRGDKVGIIGPNGCGKTTLVRLLLGELPASGGNLRRGTSLTVGYFDQLRRSLDENSTVMANVTDGSDYVTINGQQKHVASYLRDFLFSPECFNQPVSSLSGGERNRLLLAKLLAQPVNLLVLDEPTNDLDIETLELLETILLQYTGTLLLISHDRAFINQVVASVLVYESPGVFREHLGGYDASFFEVKPEKEHKVVIKNKSEPKLSTQEQRELAKLPSKIEAVEQIIQDLHAKMADPLFYKTNQVDQYEELKEQELILESLYHQWERLEAKKS